MWLQFPSHTGGRVPSTQPEGGRSTRMRSSQRETAPAHTAARACANAPGPRAGTRRAFAWLWGLNLRSLAGRAPWRWLRRSGSPRRASVALVAGVLVRSPSPAPSRLPQAPHLPAFPTPHARPVLSPRQVFLGRPPFTPALGPPVEWGTTPAPSA